MHGHLVAGITLALSTLSAASFAFDRSSETAESEPYAAPPASVGGGTFGEGSEKFPVPFVERPLTLPKMMLAPQFQIGLTHAELGNFAFNGVGLNVGAAFGVIDDLTVDIVPLTLLIGRTDAGGFSDTKAYYGTFRLGATYRFFHADVVDIGGRVEFGATGFDDTIHLTAMIPVLLRFGKIVRIDTGLAISGLFPTKGGDANGALGTVGSVVPTVPGAGPGIPIDVTFQIVDPFFVGFDTGFGIASFNDTALGGLDKSCFMPLGLHAGATIPGDKGPIADITGSFSFPLFLLGADRNPPTSEVWQLGIDARAYFQL